MITTTSRELSDFPPNQEGRTTSEAKNPNKLSSSSSSSNPNSWSRLKDPRIVRVSKTFGGKDRHSKVCTVRGLRDRRVRLSVQTAIQLYDLQDRLGLNQPSKVVDWLLNVAKHEIDELPPLPFPPLSLIQNHPQFPPNYNQGLATSQPYKEGLKINASDQGGGGGGERRGGGENASSHLFFPGLQNNININNPIPHNFLHPSLFSFSCLEDPQNLNFAPLPSIPSGSHHHQPLAAQPYFPSGPVEFDLKQLNQNLSSSLAPSLLSMKPLQYLSIGSQNQLDKIEQFPPK